MIKETLAAIVSGDVSVAFEVVPGQAELASRKTTVAVAEAPVPEEEEPVLPETSQLNPKFQFQHFVVGNNSRFAHAACRAVAETPAKAYNPLFLYGGVGLGKTHLMHAIGHGVLEKPDRPPKEIPTLEERLRSRFNWGLIADIQPADFETRVAILKSKVGPYARLVPEDVLSFIAHKIQKNIRELEGALIRVIAHASLNRSAVNVEMAAKLLQDVIPSTENRTLSIDTISRTVANFYHISLEEMK